MPRPRRDPGDVLPVEQHRAAVRLLEADRKSTRLNSSHPSKSYADFCLKKKLVVEIFSVFVSCTPELVTPRAGWLAMDSPAPLRVPSRPVVVYRYFSPCVNPLDIHHFRY